MSTPAAPATSVRSPRAIRGRPRRFHGWRIVAVLAVTETVSWGVLYYAYAVFQVPMGAELGASPAVLAGAFSLAVLLTGVAAVPVGRWLDVRGPRGLMTAGSIACTLLVVAWSQVDTVTGLYLVMAGIGLARGAVLYDPAFAVIVRWFHERRSTALLAVTVVAGFASTIALPASQALIDAVGWRQALLVLAGALATVTVLPHWLVLRAHPADLGLHPDGADQPPPPHPEEPIDARAAGLTATATWALREPAFRWYAAAFAAQATAVIVVAVHLVPLLRQHGHSAGFAAAATGALGALSVSGRLVLTGAVRRVPVGVVTAGMFALQGVGILVLLAAGSSAVGVVVFVLLFGIGFGVGTIARPALVAHSFGVARFATLAGLLAFTTTLATTAGPFAAGVARTLTGSYTPALVGVLGLCTAAAASLVHAGHLATRQTTRTQIAGQRLATSALGSGR